MEACIIILVNVSTIPGIKCLVIESVVSTIDKEIHISYVIHIQNIDISY